MKFNSVYLYDDDKLVLVLNYTGERCKVTLDLVESAVESGGLGGSCFAPSSAVYGAKSNRRGSGLRRFAHCTESTRCRKLGGFWCFSLPHNKKWGKRENG